MISAEDDGWPPEKGSTSISCDLYTQSYRVPLSAKIYTGKR